MIPKEVLHILNETDGRAWIAGAVGGISGQVVLGSGQTSRRAYQSEEILLGQQIAGWAPHLANSLVLILSAEYSLGRSVICMYGLT